MNFELPDELKDVTYESILAQMLSKIPDQYDKLEGSFVYDMVAPSALEAAELIQFWLALGLKMNFHMWAQEQWLDHHAADCGLERHAATCAYCDLEVETTQAVTFPVGFIFSVPSVGSDPAIDFETISEESFSGAEIRTIRVKAVNPGVGSNVAAHSITIMKNPIKGVARITNPTAALGGTPPETDDSLRQRIADFYAGHGHSYVGNKSDYIRWAKQVDGVGFVNCIPCYDGYNSVKLVISTTTGGQPSEEMLNMVKTYIFGDEKNGVHDLNRLAPIGVAKYSVVAPEEAAIELSLDAKLSADIEYVRAQIAHDLTDYFKTLADENNVYGTLRYQKVAAILSNVVGLDDFKNFKLDGDVENISFGEEQIPTIAVDNILLNSWT